MHPTSVSFYEIDGWCGGDFYIGTSPDEDYDDIDMWKEGDNDTCEIQREIMMDGDKYMVTILTEELYHEMLLDKNVTKALAEIGYAFGMQKTALLRKDGQKFYLVSSEDPDVVLCEWEMTMDSPLVIERASDKGYMYRPVLIPLLPNGMVDDTLASENPNGSIVTGGQIQIVTSGFLKKNKAVKFFDSAADSTCNDCVWVWFNGLMVCVKCEFSLPPIQLVEQKLTSELIFKLEETM